MHTDHAKAGRAAIKRGLKVLRNRRVVGQLDRKRKSGKPALHFLHVGKTGGTAIKYALKGHQETDRYLIYLHYHGVGLDRVPAGEGVIFFLRDPASRFVSGFSSRQRQGRPKHFTPWNAAEKSAFEHFRTPDQLASALFSADVAERNLAEHAMRSIQHVNNPYRDWLCSEEYLLSRLEDIFFVGFQENLAEDFEILKEKLDLPEGTRLPDDDIRAHRSTQDCNRMLGNPALDNLKHWYRQDYRFIERCREIRRDL